MEKQNNKPSKWPKAAVIIFGTASICSAAYFLKEANVMWAMFPLLWIVSDF